MVKAAIVKQTSAARDMNDKFLRDFTRHKGSRSSPLIMVIIALEDDSGMNENGSSDNNAAKVI